MISKQLSENNMSILTKITDVDPSKILFSKNAYTYGPSAKMVYANYESPRSSLNIMLGPAHAPFGISAYDHNLAKLSLVVNIPPGSESELAFNRLDDYLREGGLQKNMVASWTPHTPNMDYVKNCYVPTLNESPYGGQFKCSVRLVPDDPSKVKPLLLEKRWKDEEDHSQGFITERIHYDKPEDLFDIFPARSKVFVTAQLNGVIFSRSDIRLKWEAAHIIKDLTSGAMEGEEDKGEVTRDSIFTTIPDLSFLE